VTWPEGVASRAYRNQFVERWHGREQELRTRVEEVAPRYMAALQEGGTDIRAVLMSEAAASVPAIRPAGDVVRGICQEAERALRARAAAVLD
jgi:nitronate monooxygenase